NDVATERLRIVQLAAQSTLDLCGLVDIELLDRWGQGLDFDVRLLIASVVLILAFHKLSFLKLPHDRASEALRIVQLAALTTLDLCSLVGIELFDGWCQRFDLNVRLLTAKLLGILAFHNPS